MGIHMNAVQTNDETQEGELSLPLLKKYITFCRRYNQTLDYVYEQIPINIIIW